MIWLAVDIAYLPLRQDLLAKNVLMPAQMDFCLGNSLSFIDIAYMPASTWPARHRSRSGEAGRPARSCLNTDLFLQSCPEQPQQPVLSTYSQVSHGRRGKPRMAQICEVNLQPLNPEP